MHSSRRPLQEMERKLTKMAKQMDHFERAKREEESPLLMLAAQQKLVRGRRGVWLMRPAWVLEFRVFGLSVEGRKGMVVFPPLRVLHGFYSSGSKGCAGGHPLPAGLHLPLVYL